MRCSTLTPEALAAERQLRAAGHEPPPDSAFDPAALRLLREAGRAVRISPTLHVHRHTLSDVERHLHAIVSTGDHITLAHLREVLHTNRSPGLSRIGLTGRLLNRGARGAIANLHGALPVKGSRLRSAASA